MIIIYFSCQFVQFVIFDLIASTNLQETMALCLIHYTQLARDYTHNEIVAKGKKLLHLSTNQLELRSRYTALPDMAIGSAFSFLVNGGNRWAWTSNAELTFIRHGKEFAKFENKPIRFVRKDRTVPIEEYVRNIPEDEMGRIQWTEFLLIILINKNPRLIIHSRISP